MSGALLKPADRDYFLKMMRLQMNSAIHRGMNVLLLFDDGWSNRRVSEALFIDEGTMRDHRQLYEHHGRDGVEKLIYPVGAAARAD